ncbi:MAG: hypothetical protein COS89_05270 [Deltaproteobacteria bacterium CG07_land_8_20_14_0_80_38_7]|nr:MAG: hypothetical protein COS89_05270 [Deltaproteobacteria bacterium CG07_land_8_20_14_0_80_38_7]
MKLDKDKKKAEQLELAGDELALKNKFEKALKKYKKALEKTPDNTSLYNKLISTKDKIEKNWGMDDFVESVSWAMEKQEIEDPAIKQLHIKLSPNWDKATKLALKIITIDDKDKDFSKLIEEYILLGNVGTLVLIDILRKAFSENKNVDNNQS